MAKVKILDKMIAELIAAGEVVERPASIVKELVENSIDAGSTKVTVEIKGGGIGYISISDNGSGIDCEDIQNAFLRHATSKVSSAADLDSISTLGFRGEALNSVAAVSKVEIITKTADSLDGWQYEIWGGTALEIPMAVGAPNGTTFIVRDIFYNTPARMKFLRSDIAEGNAVAQIVDKCALSHPEISFTFIRDTKIRLQTSGNGDLLAVIRKIYGKDISDNMLEIEYSYENKVRVKGFIGKPGNSKPSRNYQTFFINNRYVRTQTCSAALNEGFKGKLMTGRFPIGVLFVDVDYSMVDANVHPAKIEVRFTQEKDIFNGVYFGVKNALHKNNHGFVLETPAEKRSLSTTSPFAPANKQDTQMVQQRMKPISEYPSVSESIGGEENSGKITFNAPSKEAVLSPESRLEFSEKVYTFTPKRPSVNIDIAVEFPTSTPNPTLIKPEELIVEDDVRGESFRYIGEFSSTYILLESDDNKLVLVDKHAVHERLIYEEVKANSATGMRQILLSALPVSLQKDEYAILIENLDMLEKLGFLVEDFGTGTLLVREVATSLESEEISYILSEIAGKLLSSNRDLTPNALDELYYSMACKAAVRGGDYSNQAELIEIVKRLEKSPDITHCPHGRPVMITISNKEIEKKFGRLG